MHRLRGGGRHESGYRALRWQSLITDGNAGPLGDYSPIIWLPRKAALFLFEYHDTEFRGKIPGLPQLPAPQDRDEYLDVHNMVQKPELRGLLDTLNVRPAMRDQGHFRLFGTLAIGHAAHPGVQRVQCWPFKDVLYYGANRQDFVIVRPPGSVADSFTPTEDNVWYCKTLLLFDMEAETDGGPVVYQCAYVSLLEKMKPRQPDPYDALLRCGSRVIYEQNVEVSYMFCLLESCLYA